MSQIEELFQRIDALKAELDALRPLDREREQRLMQKFRLWWTYHSNAIEGNSLTQGETEMFLMEGLTAKGKPLKDHLDLRGHSNAINYLLGFVRDKGVLTEAAIRELHKVLLIEPYRVEAITPDGLPTMKTVALGEYKTQPNHVRTPTGETHFYATPEETPAKMHDLMEWYRSETARSEMHVVEVAARFHHRFTAIHPFDDGNGRMSRLLMNLMLMQGGFMPSVIRISERNQYLLALRKADRGDDNEFIALIAEQVEESLELALLAATGAEISEPTDIEKEISLEILRLRHVEEPEPLTPVVQQRIISDSINPLLAETARLLTPLCDLFSKQDILVSGQFRGDFTKTGIQGFSIKQSIPNFSGMPTVVNSQWSSISVFTQLSCKFELKGFKKARFDTFELSVTLEADFKSLHYSVRLPSTAPPLTIQHFYQESLTTDETSHTAQMIARIFLDSIRRKTNCT